MVNAGLRLVIGSWNAIAISSPRTLRISLNDSESRSRPSNITEPDVMRPGGDAIRRITASDDTVLPEPDSPTSATTSPAATPKLTWSTTVAWPGLGEELHREVRHRQQVVGGRGGGRVRRPDHGGEAEPSLDPLLALRHAEAERVADAVAEGVERQDREHERQARDVHLPRVLAQLEPGVLDHGAPARRRSLHAEAEQAELGLGDEGEADGERHGHDQRRRDVRQHALAPDAAGLRAHRVRRLDERLLAHRKRLCADQAGRSPGSSPTRWRGPRSRARRRACRRPRARARAAGSWRGRPSPA